MRDETLKEMLATAFDRPWTISGELYRNDETGVSVHRVESQSETCALKVLPMGKARAVECDREQMEAMSRCPSIVPVYETAIALNGGEHVLMIRMELLTPLSEWLEETPDADEGEALKVGVAVARALSFCRTRLVAHRDIKPQNIFRAADGAYKLGDFGISRRLDGQAELTRTALNEFTPLYAAPEVLLKREIDPYRADIYSLGLVLYRMINGGVMPFGPCGQEHLLEKRRAAGDIPMPECASRAVRALLWKALRYSPMERYASTDEMLEDLEAVLRGSTPESLAAYDAFEGDRLLAAGEYDQAARLLTGALEAGYRGAARSLGICRFYGFGVPQDAECAIGLLQPFADEGDAQACLLLGRYYYGETVRHKDHARAVRYFTAAAQAGLADAQFYLGYCYRKGYAVKADEDEAQRWFRMAAAQGHVGAQSYVRQEAYWGLFDWMATDGDQAVRITRCKFIDPMGRVFVPEAIESHPVTALAEWMFLESPPQEGSREGALDLLDQTCDALRSIHLPASLRIVKPGAFRGCVALESVRVASDSTHFKLVDGVLLTADGKALILYPPARTNSVFQVPNGVEIIADGAFECSAHLREVRLPASLKRVGRLAFAGCRGLRQLSIPEGVETIGGEALIFCESLEEVTLPESLRVIGEHLVSRRYRTAIRCAQGTPAEWYAQEQMIPCRTSPLDQELLVALLLPLAVAYERHPKGVPITSGSYQIIMSTGRAVWQKGGLALIEEVLRQFERIYGHQAMQLRAYWKVYLNG